jgi:hypothetical protein
MPCRSSSSGPWGWFTSDAVRNTLDIVAPLMCEDSTFYGTEESQGKPIFQAHNSRRSKSHLAVSKFPLRSIAWFLGCFTQLAHAAGREVLSFESCRGAFLDIDGWSTGKRPQDKHLDSHPFRLQLTRSAPLSCLSFHILAGA